MREINLNDFRGECVCGKTHEIITKKIIIEPGCIHNLGCIADELGLKTGGVIVCDSNTERYAAQAEAALNNRLGPRRVVTLAAEGLHADENATARLGFMLPENAGWLLAVGSGTIHDITRYTAHERGIPFVACPTAASVDGFVSTVSAMTWHGFKKTMPGAAPLAVVADTDIFATAPKQLTLSGVGDVLGKITALADWEISHILTDEPFCTRIRELTARAVSDVRGNLASIREGEPDNMEKLLYALLMTGIAMQMWGNSRPASGAEHHISHFWEMEAINGHVDALHGERVGVGLLLALKKYKEIAKKPDLSVISAYDGMPHDLLKQIFGVLYGALAEENTPDLLGEIPLERLREKLPEITAIINALPSPDEIERGMAASGCRTTPRELGLSDSVASATLVLSPFVRRRLTFMRLAKLLK